MKANHSIRLRPLALCYLAATFAGLAAASHAQAQAVLSFSGGSGTPLTITLSQPLTFTITTAETTLPYFTFKNVGNVFGSETGDGVTGNITYEINAGGALTFAAAGSDYTGGDTAPTDLSLQSSANSSFVVGDVVTLSAGTETTNDNFAATAPAGGSFTAFIADEAGYSISTDGVPEPSTWALLGLGVAGLLALTLRRRVLRV